MASSTKVSSKRDGSHWKFILHGGCSESCPDIDRQQEISRNLHEIAEKVSNVLANGLTAKDAVMLAVSALEDCPVFNAGHGAALNQDGIHQVSECNLQTRSSRKETEYFLHSLKRALSMVTRLIMAPSEAPKRRKTRS